MQGLGTDQEDERIVAAVVDLAANLGLRSIAEGVETQEQLRAAARPRLRPGSGLPVRTADAVGSGPCGDLPSRGVSLLRGRQRSGPAEVEALRVVDAEVAQQLERRLVLDAFGDGL